MNETNPAPEPAPANPQTGEATDTPPTTPDKAEKPEQAAPEQAEAVEPSSPPPPPIDINEFREKPLLELHEMAEVLSLRVPANASKAQLVFDLLCAYGRDGVELFGQGVVEQAKENYAMLRDPNRSFRTSPDDIYLGGQLLRQHGVKVGQLLKVQVRPPRRISTNSRPFSPTAVSFSKARGTIRSACGSSI